MGFGPEAFKKRICNINETTGEIQPLAAGTEVIRDDEDIYPDRNGRDRFAYSWTVDSLYYCEDMRASTHNGTHVALVAMGFSDKYTFVVEEAPATATST